MSKLAKEFPKIKGLTWLSNEFPDLVCIGVTMENRRLIDLGIPSPIIVLDFYLDLSKLAGVKDWYEADSDEPSLTECCVDFDGISQMVLNITKDELLKAWMFYKQFYKQ